MKNIFLLIYFICLVSCNDTNYNEKFLNLEKQTFTDFKGYSITYRNGIYLVSDANIEKDSNRIFIKMNNSGNIRYIEDINKNIITKPEIELNFLEKMLNKFNNFNVSNISVDKNENIQFLFFSNKCSYTFLQLSKKSRLKDLNKSYFEKYKDNWYLYKQCSK
ncbi:hypothetical protein [Elizabethkingia miricola]|uniref:hypothetical protein n=1 Tax=Elizabethkingia miricola TaxID=172045 RepID=UPI003891D6CC